MCIRDRIKQDSRTVRDIKNIKHASCGELSETSEEEQTDEHIKKHSNVENLDDTDEESIEEEIFDENLISEQSIVKPEPKLIHYANKVHDSKEVRSSERNRERVRKKSIESNGTEFDLKRISFTEDTSYKMYTEITDSSDCLQGKINVIIVTQ